VEWRAEKVFRRKQRPEFYENRIDRNGGGRFLRVFLRSRRRKTQTIGYVPGFTLPHRAGDMAALFERGKITMKK
jgi:hypothetical protein